MATVGKARRGANHHRPPARTDYTSASAASEPPASFSPPGEKVGGGAVRMRGMVEANWLADDPEPAYPSSVSLREPPVGGSHAIRLHPHGEKEAVTLCYLFADL